VLSCFSKTKARSVVHRSGRQAPAATNVRFVTQPPDVEPASNGPDTSAAELYHQEEGCEPMQGLNQLPVASAGVSSTGSITRGRSFQVMCTSVHKRRKIARAFLDTWKDLLDGQDCPSYGGGCSKIGLTRCLRAMRQTWETFGRGQVRGRETRAQQRQPAHNRVKRAAICYRVVLMGTRVRFNRVVSPGFTCARVTGKAMGKYLGLRGNSYSPLAAVR
jgi:hypothetical protein